MKVITTNEAPAAIGPYSQAISVSSISELVFASGQIPVDPKTNTVGEGIEVQARQSCENVKSIMNASGLGMENIVKTTCFLADIADFAKFNAVYEEYFISKPARSCVAVKDLPNGVLCEIEAIGVK